MNNGAFNNVSNGTIGGYASIFNVPDLTGDVVLRGAFKETLSQTRPKQIKMLYQHNLTNPIGVWHNIEETAYGLWVSGTLAPNVQLASETASLIHTGALDGLSIGFRVRKSSGGKGRIRRHLRSVELVEISIVTLPMQPRAKITQFKH